MNSAINDKNFLLKLIETLPILHFGCTGSYVKLLQILLSYHGYNIKEDGYFGAITKHFVEHWQRRHNLQDDGIVNRVVWMTLFII